MWIPTKALLYFLFHLILFIGGFIVAAFYLKFPIFRWDLNGYKASDGADDLVEEVKEKNWTFVDFEKTYASLKNIEDKVYADTLPKRQGTETNPARLGELLLGNDYYFDGELETLLIVIFLLYFSSVLGFVICSKIHKSLFSNGDNRNVKFGFIKVKRNYNLELKPQLKDRKRMKSLRFQTQETSDYSYKSQNIRTFLFSLILSLIINLMVFSFANYCFKGDLEYDFFWKYVLGADKITKKLSYFSEFMILLAAAVQRASFVNIISQTAAFLFSLVF